MEDAQVDTNANLVAPVKTINEAMSGDVFMITPSVMEPYDIPWNYIVIIRAEGGDAVVQRVDPVTDKTIKGFSTKNRLGLNPSNTTFIKTARNFEQRNRDFQDRYPFQPNANADMDVLFQVPFNKAQMKDYPNMDSFCVVGQTRLDCLFHTLAALRLRSIDQCTKDARVCNALARFGVKYTEAANYLSKITGQRIKITDMTIKRTNDMLNTFLYDGYGTIVAIESKPPGPGGEIIGHYTIAFKNGGIVDYYDPQYSDQMDYGDVVSIRLFVRDLDERKDNSEIAIPPISVAEADSHVIPYNGGIAKYRTRAKTTRKRIKTTRKIKRMKRMRFKTTRRARNILQRK